MPKQERTQRTPQGHEIPVPTRGQVFGNLEKAAKPVPSRRRKRRAK